MAEKLWLYNRALDHLGERRLASLTENREPRRLLDGYYPEAVRFCLEQGLWNFATRTVEIEASTEIDAALGFTHAFGKPDDWIRTAQASATESFAVPLLGRQLVDEAGAWYADCDPLYVQYISADPAYGGDLGSWPETFSEYVALRLARLGCRRITGSETTLDVIKRDERRALMDARSKDALNQTVGFPPMGSWAASRSGRFARSSRE